MSDLQELQYPIDQAIFAELLPCLPPTWKKTKLVASQPPSGRSMKMRIEALGQPGAASPSDELQAAVRELFVLNNRFNSGLLAIEYSYELLPDGKWSFAGDYKYAD